LALLEGCKHSLEITIPVDAIDAETTKVVGDYQKVAKLPGFRPGKAPPSLIRRNFEGGIRQKVLESLIPKFFENQAKEEGLNVVSRPDVTDVHFHAGEPIRFKAEFEVAPEFELEGYKGVTVSYKDPEVSDQDVDQRIEELRNEKATFVNEDSRPLTDGDFAVVSIESLEGIDKPLKNDELQLELGAKDTLEGFTENLRGMSPGEEKDFDVIYPEEHGQTALAGKTVRFHCVVKGLRRKELPDLNDEFAQDIGDYRSVAELRDEARKGIFASRQFAAIQEAKGKLMDTLVAQNEFPVPQVFVERQIDSRLNQTIQSLASQGVDPRALNLDWQKLKDSQRDKATHDVRASLILGRVAERESIYATKAEVDREVEGLARQRRMPVPALRPKLEEDGTIGRIASHIQTEKTLRFLFENANKVAE
jgi:trigger factor